MFSQKLEHRCVKHLRIRMVHCMRCIRDNDPFVMLDAALDTLHHHLVDTDAFFAVDEKDRHVDLADIGAL